jgi:hypothetical protein
MAWGCCTDPDFQQQLDWIRIQAITSCCYLVGDRQAGSPAHDHEDSAAYTMRNLRDHDAVARSGGAGLGSFGTSCCYGEIFYSAFGWLRQPAGYGRLGATAMRCVRAMRGGRG